MRYSKEELEKQRQERLKEKRKNKEIFGGYEMRIIRYDNANNIIVEFQDEYKAKVHTKYCHFVNGQVKNPYHLSICNIGYIGMGKYKSIDEDGKKTKAYIIWSNMLRRCYDPYIINKHITYKDCIVCNEWHNFQNFAEWYENNYYEVLDEKMHLDKDILIKGNKIYSPETCMFVPQRINTLFVKKDVNRGHYPIGLYERYCKNILKICVKCSISDKKGSKRIYLGDFPLDRPFQAFTVYKNFKENYIKQVADEYKDLIPKELYEALYKYEVEIND